MGTIARTAKAGGGTNFNAGQTIDPDEVNTDFNTLFTEANGALDDGNIETATIPGAKTLRFTEISAPSSPASNDLLVYAKDDGGTTRLFSKDSAGTEVGLSASMPRAYLAGLGTVQAADADHDITIAVGACRDSTNAHDLVLAAALTKRLDAIWAVGDTNGGIDAGGIATSTVYAIWLIKRSDTGVVDALFSTSFSAPTMPASYDFKRRIGAVITDSGSAILDFTQRGDWFQWTAPIVDLAADATEAATVRTLSVPPSTMALVHFHVDFTIGGTGLYLSGTDQTDAAPSATASPLATDWSDISIRGGPAIVKVDASRQIRSRLAGTLDGNNFSLATVGWWDRRGRDD